MFINVAEELRKAREGKYALGAFNTNNLEVTKAICRAAQKLDREIIIQTTQGSIKYAGLEQIFNIIKTEIETTGIRAAIHLDHAKDFEACKECIDIGYKSVMIDGSRFPFAENVALTKKVVEYAHERNVSVEAEIGVLGIEEGGEATASGAYSNPEETKRFVDLTGIDSVAVSIGNEHGAPHGEKIDLELLARIAGMIEIPLVLHGASGLADEEIREAIKLGITKINIDTNVRKAFINGMREFDPATKDYRDILSVGMANVSEVVENRISTFRS